MYSFIKHILQKYYALKQCTVLLNLRRHQFIHLYWFSTMVGL